MEKEMEMDIEVMSMVQRVLPPEADNQVPSQREGLVKIGFVVKDTLKVLEEDGKVIMSQCICEETTISMNSSQVDDLDYVKQLAFRTLRDNLHMDPRAADTASPDVATAIRDSFQTAKDTNPHIGTVLLEIYIECSIRKAGRGPEGTTGEHGYAKLLQRIDEEVCGRCHKGFSLPADIFIPNCPHTFHYQCFREWLNSGSYSCPSCRS